MNSYCASCRPAGWKLRWRSKLPTRNSARRALVESIEQELLNGAEQARIISAYLYRTDASTLTDFLDTQRAYNETAQSYYEAQAATRRAAIHLNASVGKEVVPWSGTGLGNLDR